ncbi:MAG TPA: SGNH/GDSL hydrolase family protein [Flavobacteriaceae bacterium]
MKNLKLILVVLVIVFGSENYYAQDWANLKRFQDENAQLSIPNSGQQRIVFMGNSITEGWIKSRPGFFEGKPYINRGIGGQTTPQMLLRFRQDVIDLKPSAVVILAGINDIAGNTGPSTIEMIKDNLVSMAELAMTNNIKVVLCSVLPAKDFPWRPGLEPAEKVIKLNTLLQSYAEEHHLVYVDYFSAMVDGSNGLREDLGSDGVHPNALGYSIMEPIVEEGIAKALKQN